MKILNSIHILKPYIKKYRPCAVLALLIILLIGSAGVPGIAESAGQVQEINSRQLFKMMSKSTHPVIIDISTQGEYNEAHIKGSLWGDVGLIRTQTEQYLNSLGVKKSDIIILVCESGRKSFRTVRILVEASYKNVYNLAGGKIDWARNGYELVVENPSTIAEKTISQRPPANKGGNESKEEKADSPRVIIKAYLNISSGCQGEVIDLLESLKKKYPGKVKIEYIDFGTREGLERTSKDGLHCMAILINDKQTINMGNKAVTFSHPMGLQWTAEDMKMAVKQEVERMYK